MPKTYNKCVINNVIYLDLSNDTVTADSIVNGYTAHDKNGEIITGTILDGDYLSYGLTDGTLPIVGVAKVGSAEI